MTNDVIAEDSLADNDRQILALLQAYLQRYDRYPLQGELANFLELAGSKSYSLLKSRLEPLVRLGYLIHDQRRRGIRILHLPTDIHEQKVPLPVVRTLCEGRDFWAPENFDDPLWIDPQVRILATFAWKVPTAGVRGLPWGGDHWLLLHDDVKALEDDFVLAMRNGVPYVGLLAELKRAAPLDLPLEANFEDFLQDLPRLFGKVVAFHPPA